MNLAMKKTELEIAIGNIRARAKAEKRDLSETEVIRVRLLECRLALLQTRPA